MVYFTITCYHAKLHENMKPYTKSEWVGKIFAFLSETVCSNLYVVKTIAETFFNTPGICVLQYKTMILCDANFHLSEQIIANSSYESLFQKKLICRG